MNEVRTVKVSLAIPSALLKIVDDLARRDYATRSEIFRLAILQYTQKPENMPPNAQALLEVLAAKPLEALRRYQKGQIAFKGLIEGGIDAEMQMELMKLGEL